MIIPYLILSHLVGTGTPTSNTKETLTIYTYDSMMAKGGLGEKLFSPFEARENCKVRVIAAGDSLQMLGRVELDQKTEQPSADLLIGVDQLTWTRAKAFADLWGEWRPHRYQQIDPKAVVEPGFLPFDFGTFAMMVNTSQITSPPKSLRDLAKKEWSKKFILEDPRTSTPGFAFVVLTREVFKAEFQDFWKNLKGRWLNLSPGWDTAYGLFLKGEAPLVWSYSTSEAYHRNAGQDDQYRAHFFKEGSLVQVEGAILLRDSQHKDLGRKFLEFILSREIQESIPKTQWMFPAIQKTKLPKEFQNLPEPEKIIRPNLESLNVKEVLKSWQESLSTR